MSQPFVGRRVYYQEGSKFETAFTQPGDYGKDLDGKWHFRLPNWTAESSFNGHTVGAHDTHIITEHEDGSITVSPSILWDEACAPSYPDSWWHGWLKAGIWTSV